MKKSSSEGKKLKITKRKKIQKRFLQFAIKTVQVADSDSSVSGNFLVLISSVSEIGGISPGKWPEFEGNLCKFLTSIGVFW